MTGHAAQPDTRRASADAARLGTVVRVGVIARTRWSTDLVASGAGVQVRHGGGGLTLWA